MTKAKIIQKEKNQSPAESEIHEPNLWTIPDNILVGDQRLFYPDWSNQPPPAKPIISIDGKRILTQGNYLAIISRGGAGKSSICESLVAKFMNPKCDGLGFELTMSHQRDMVLYIDTERTVQDTWLSWQRAMRRANIQKPETDKRLIVVNFKAVAVGERIEYTNKLLKDNPDIRLVIFDGGSDFVNDVNSIPETAKFTDWINSFNPQISQVITLHTNPTDNKPRGHLGSELLRRAESVLLLRKVDEKVREITTNFEHGKVRNDNDILTFYYQWSATHEMFISSEYSAPAPREQEKTQAFMELANEMFNGRIEASYGYMVDFIINRNKVGEPRAKQIIGQMTGKAIEKMAKNVWQLKSQSV